MCQMLNAFVPTASAAQVALVAPVRGLSFGALGEVQRDFAARSARGAGAVLIGRRRGDCLCGFDDWPALYEALRALLVANRAERVEALLFWSGDRYALSERAVDLDEPRDHAPFALGEVVIARIEPAERRRHRGIVRALAGAVGADVTLRLKSGRELRGTIEEFDPESEVGRIGGRAFVAGEVMGIGEERRGG